VIIYNCTYDRFALYMVAYGLVVWMVGWHWWPMRGSFRLKKLSLITCLCRTPAISNIYGWACRLQYNEVMTVKVKVLA